MSPDLMEGLRGSTALPAGAEDLIAVAAESVETAQAELVSAIHLFQLRHIGLEGVQYSRRRLEEAHYALQEVLTSAGI